MRIEFQDLSLKNFKCFSNATFRLDQGAGLHFLRGINKDNERLGSNGAGKSTLFDAISWVLFGKTVKGMRNPDVTPWSGAGNPSVGLRLSVDGEEHLLERNKTRLLLNGKVIGPDDVENLIGLNYTLFSQAIIMGQGRDLFLDLSPRDKMTLFSEVLQLDRWEDRSNAARKEASAHQLKLTTIDGVIRGLETAVEDAQTALSEAKEAAEAWSKKRAQRTKKLEAGLSKLEAKADKASKKYGDAHLKADMAGAEDRALTTSLRKLNDQLIEAEAKRSDLTHAYESTSEDYREAVRRIRSLNKAKTCPTCGQKVTPENLANHLDELNTRADKLSTKRDKLKTALGVAELAVLDLRAKQTEDQNNQNEMQEQLDDATAAEKRLADQLAEALGELKAAQLELAQLKEDNNPHRETVNNARKRLKDIEMDLEDEEKLERISAVKLERANFWAKGFKDIRLGIIDEVLEEMNLATADLLDQVGMGDWEIRYTIERETKSGTTQRSLAAEVTSPASGGPAKWEAWSGGEGQRLRLCASLAFAEIVLEYAGLQTNLRVLDEPTRGLSPEGVQDLTSLLAEYANDCELSLWYVDHHSIESTLFASVATVIGENKQSKVEQ